MDFASALSWVNFGFMMKGLLVTLQVAFFSIIISFVLGTLFGVIRYSRIPVLNPIVYVYILVIRNSPLLLLIFFTFFALPQVGIKLDIITASVAALSVFTSALIAEIVRGGLQSIEKGQVEASQSQGFSYIQTLWHIVLPQALTRMIPAIVSQFITLIKDTSLCMMIGLLELVNSGKVIYAQNVNFIIPLLLFIAFVYFSINFSLSVISRKLEKRLSVA